ncbi:MAG TPA: universal stress protein [Gaiellales bacterium]|nr:universal stress protein [Gaiellales bacterium]
MKKIVVGYDGTDEARTALARAADVAKAMGGTVVVTSVAPMVVSAGRSAGPIDPVDPPSVHEAQLDEARRYLSERGIDTHTVIAIGDPAEGIIDAAAEHAADLIVVGTRDPGIVERLLGHSVSQAVARKAECDVLIVRRAG